MKITYKKQNKNKFTRSYYSALEEMYSIKKLSYKLFKNGFSRTERNTFISLYEKGFTFTKSAYLEFNARTGCWLSISKPEMTVYLSDAGLDPIKWFKIFKVMINSEKLVEFERRQNENIYFLQKNLTFIRINLNKGKFYVTLHDLKDPDSLDKIKSCHFTPEICSDFNLDLNECNDLTIKLNKVFGDESQQNYYSKYNTLCPKILNFIRNLNSYYDKDNNSNVCYETSGNILNWLILLTFKSQSQEGNKLTYTNVSKVLSISGASRGGKSQLANLMRILGCGSVATGSFCRLKDRFESSGWYNKAAIVFHEVSIDESNMDTIYKETKMLTGRDPLKVEFKYGDITDANFSGLVVMVSQRKLPIPQNDFVAVSRRFSCFIVEESQEVPVNDFANEVLSKEILPFTLLTWFLTCDLETNSWDGETFNEKFLKDLTNKINTYSLDTVMLSTIDMENNTYNKYLFKHVDQATISAMQLEVIKTKSSKKTKDILLPEIALLYLRQILSYPGSVMVVKDFSKFADDFKNVFKSDSRLEWTKFHSLCKDHMLPNLSKVRDVNIDSSMAALLTPILDTDRTIPERSVWDNLLKMLLDRVEYLRMLGFKMDKWEYMRKSIKSVEEVDDETGDRGDENRKKKVAIIYTLVLALRLIPYDPTAKMLLDPNCHASEIDILKPPVLRRAEISEDILNNYTWTLRTTRTRKITIEETLVTEKFLTPIRTDTKNLTPLIIEPENVPAIGSIEYENVLTNDQFQRAKEKINKLQQELQAAIIQENKRLIQNKRVNIKYWKTKIKDDARYKHK